MALNKETKRCSVDHQGWLKPYKPLLSSKEKKTKRNFQIHVYSVMKTKEERPYQGFIQLNFTVITTQGKKRPNACKQEFKKKTYLIGKLREQEL